MKLQSYSLLQIDYLLSYVMLSGLLHISIVYRKCGASLSYPHTSELSGGISYMSYVVCHFVNAGSYFFNIAQAGYKCS